jgi:hypothetical protein
MVLGNLVVDYEEVTGLADVDVLHAIAIYIANKPSLYNAGTAASIIPWKPPMPPPQMYKVQELLCDSVCQHHLLSVN